MTAIRLSSVLLVLALSAAGASAQEPSGASASSATTAGSGSQDCAKPGARHNHAAEKDAPPSVSGPCAPARSAASKAKAKPLHDHAKFNKNE